MITKEQTKKLVGKMEAHRVALQEILDGLVAHAPHHEDAINSLRLTVHHLDDAADFLNSEPIAHAPTPAATAADFCPACSTLKIGGVCRHCNP